ncbi:MAG: hypothetical protein GY930_13810 [bacterium]|nr:hypothetical protein [bacterium]
MAFGSSALFDAHFNAAHFLKIVAYGTPVIGLLVVYVRTLRNQRSQLTALEDADSLLREERDSLALANVQLGARNAELDEFAYVASHDLQEPLRKMTAYSDLLIMDVGEDLNEDATQDLKFITEAAERMSILIGDILTLSRENSTELQLAPVDLVELVQATLDDLEGRIVESNAQVSVAALPSVMGDARALSQIFLNLISNALKYCKEITPIISITCKVDGEFIILNVDDNGIGIAEEYRHEVFAPFKRLHGRAEYEGTGIGLAICKKSVLRMEEKSGLKTSRGQEHCLSFRCLNLNTPRKPPLRQRASQFAGRRISAPALDLRKIKRSRPKQSIGRGLDEDHFAS